MVMNNINIKTIFFTNNLFNINIQKKDRLSHENFYCKRNNIDLFYAPIPKFTSTKC
jgi:hypothetical protein